MYQFQISILSCQNPYKTCKIVLQSKKRLQKVSLIVQLSVYLLYLTTYRHLLFFASWKREVNEEK